MELYYCVFHQMHDHKIKFSNRPSTVQRSGCMCVFIPALSVSLTPVLLLLGCQPTPQHPPLTPAQHTSKNRKP